MNAESINMFAIVFVYPAKKMKDLPFKKRCALNELTYTLLRNKRFLANLIL